MSGQSENIKKDTIKDKLESSELKLVTIKEACEEYKLYLEAHQNHCFLCCYAENNIVCESNNICKNHEDKLSIAELKNTQPKRMNKLKRRLFE
jgi:hypothetical protein